MPLIEDALTENLRGWMETNRPTGIPTTIPIIISNRDAVRTRPCIVLEAPESKRVTAMRQTARVKLDVHLFSQAHDTTAADHGVIAKDIEDMLDAKTAIQTDLNSTTFKLHDLILRETSTVPDEDHGRETVLSYEAVVSAA
jgi:hypothetical protein